MSRKWEGGSRATIVRARPGTYELPVKESRALREAFESGDWHTIKRGIMNFEITGKALKAERERRGITRGAAAGVLGCTVKLYRCAERGVKPSPTYTGAGLARLQDSLLSRFKRLPDERS